MIYVTWHPRWENAEMLELHPDLQACVNTFEKNIIERQTNTHTEQLDIDNLINQGFEGNPHDLTHYTWLSTQGHSIRKKAIFDFLPTNPQTDIIPTWRCKIIIRSVDLMKNLPASDPTEEGNLPLNMPIWHTCKAACIYNIDGKCTGMLTTERLSILLEGYNAAKAAGLHNTIQPPVQDPATEIMGLLQRQKLHQNHPYTSKPNKVNISNTLITPQHIRTALQKWGLVTMERFSNPLEYDPMHTSYCSKDYRV